MTEAKSKRDGLKRSKESCEQRLTALEGRTIATWATLPDASSSKVTGTKRKARLPCEGKPGPSKVRRRRKSDDSSDSDSDSDSDDSRDELDAISGDDIDAEYEEVTPEVEESYDPAVLGERVQELEEELEKLDELISGIATEGRLVIEEKAVIDQEMTDAQGEKDAFCALKRNEVCGIAQYVTFNGQLTVYIRRRKSDSKMTSELGCGSLKASAFHLDLQRPNCAFRGGSGETGRRCVRPYSEYPRYSASASPEEHRLTRGRL